MSNQAPLVSVIMPVYNALPYVGDAVASILSQSFSDFELLLINDGSQDGSDGAMRAFRDDRIRYLANPENRGLVYSLNRGLESARGTYIARMDADDLAHVHRFRIQVAFLERRPAYIGCGTWVRILGTSTVWKSEHQPLRLRANVIFNSPLFHPTVMFRSEVFHRYGFRYDQEMTHAEDYDLWTRMSRKGRITNLRRPLVDHRLHAGSVTSIYGTGQSESTERVRRRELSLLGIEPSDVEMKLHRSLCTSTSHLPVLDWSAIREWCERIETANNRSHYVEQKALHTVITERIHALHAFEKRNMFRRMRYRLFRLRELVTPRGA